MKTTDKSSCNILIEVLKSHNVKNIILSPGSRNAPLIIAAARESYFKKTIIIDERSAAFVAIGMCASNYGEEAVALICTSGSALLNYAPAIAEAYYRNLPIIIISADRPSEWIDQDDSQTLRQYEALSNYVKKSYNIPANCDTDNLRWYVNRIVNDAIITSTTQRKAPVHINIQLDEPLNNFIDITKLAPQRIINSPNIFHKIDENVFKCNIINKLKNKHVLIIAGFQNFCKKNWVNLNGVSGSSPLENILKNNNNFVLLTESLANINCELSIDNIDRNLSILSIEDKQNIKPDIVITFGGALVSRHIKQFLREIKPSEHWHIGITDNTIDCFQSLTMRIEMYPNEFFEQLSQYNNISNNIQSNHYSYKYIWENLAKMAKKSHENYINNCNWGDLKAFSIIIPQLKGNLHLSNGTPIRYQQLFDKNKHIISVNCNRGVSGIDGCTSTAIGHALISNDPTILITGDLSAQYDISALTINKIPSNFKMIVMCNGGGGIFRFIKSTSDLPELEEYFVINNNLPLKELATGYNFSFYSATNEDELIKQLPQFLSQNNNPAILTIYTPAKENALILKEYFNRK